jgi:hypothetical protein
VTKVSGDTITVKATDGTTYTVSTSDATISLVKTISVNDLKEGDTVMVSGTTSGTTVTATRIRVGDLPTGGPGGMGGQGGPGMGGQGGPGAGGSSSGSSSSSSSSGTVTHT